MRKILGKEVRITNLALLEFIENEKGGDPEILNNLNMASCIEIVCYFTGIAIDELKQAINEDMLLAGEVKLAVIEGIKIKGESSEPGKKKAIPAKKRSR